MNTLLIIVTLVSLPLAVVLLALNWRLIRDERRRSAARMEALLRAVSNLPAASAAENVSPLTTLEPPRQELRVKLEAGVSRPSTIADEPAVSALMPEGADQGIEHVGPVVNSSQQLFHEVAEAASGFHRLALPVSLGVVIVSALLVGLLMWNHGQAAPAPVPLASVAPDNSASVPLELISLRHERTGNGLSIIGLIRNPASGRRVSDLNVVVSLFDPNGSLLTSASEPLDFRILAPGDESPFTISLDKIGTVGRYRVSFRADDRVVPHIDRRDGRVVAVASIH